MPQILQPAVFIPSTLGTMAYSQEDQSSLDEAHSLNNVTDDEGTIPKYYFSPRFSTTSTYQPGEASPSGSDNFPTPRAHLFDMSKPSPQPSPRYLTSSQPAQHRVSRTDPDFDPLYDISDDEEEVPLKISASVKKVVATSRSSSRYPSIVIPSPSAWPTIEKLHSAMSAVPPTSAQLLSPSKQALSLITTHNLQVPLRSTTPSLDGSLTSEEMDRLSCPSTPDTQKRPESLNVDEWGPVQLDYQALETLQHLGRSSVDQVHEQQVSQLIEAEGGEMREVSRPSLGLTIPALPTQHDSVASTPLSALSIPSPGGFFSSLQSTARHTWSIPPKVQDSAPNTSTAENFYSLPWETRRNTINTERMSTLAGSTLDGFEGSLTPKPTIPVSPQEDLEVKEINPSKTIFEYNESYNAELQKLTTVNLERTSHWLEEQDELQAALRDMSDMGSPRTTEGTHSRKSSLEKVSRKKSVKFADEVEKSPKEDKPKKVETYVQGFEYIREKSQKDDAFIHRQTRAEAMHVQRRCNPESHRDQLLGKFELTDPVRPAPPRPVSEFYMNDPTVLKERIARAQSERQALDQLAPSTWVLQAMKQMNNGKLVSKSAHRCITRTSIPRILDVGGVPTNDWAWQVAFDYSYATVTTVHTAGQNLTENVSGPDNHKLQVVPNLWTLPFPSGHFDVVSARSLYELLKTDKPLGKAADEYDLCLKECFRVLKPNGILDFSLIDADIIHAGRQAQAMGVEFGFNLKTRGYDAAPTKSFLPRLNKAGFKDVQRMWMILPMGKTAANWKDNLPVGAERKQEERSISPDGEVRVEEAPVFGTTADAAMMTGVVGSWMYERWMLKMQSEMGKDEEKLLEGVVNVLEEGAREGSGWRYLTGCARK